jgi:hypothetical protein
MPELERRNLCEELWARAVADSGSDITPVSEVKQIKQYIQEYTAEKGSTVAAPKAVPSRRPPLRSSKVFEKDEEEDEEQVNQSNSNKRGRAGGSNGGAGARSCGRQHSCSQSCHLRAPRDPHHAGDDQGGLRAAHGGQGAGRVSIGKRSRHAAVHHPRHDPRWRRQAGGLTLEQYDKMPELERRNLCEELWARAVADSGSDVLAAKRRCDYQS